MSTVPAIANAFRMTDDAWRRHANPWSVYTRFAAIPPLLLAIWSRVWLGWWALVPVAVVVIWLWLNPRVFRPVPPRSWAARGIYGEQIWATDRARIPHSYRVAFRLIAIPGVVGLALTAWGLLALDLWTTSFGATLVVLAQLWRIDRLAACYDELVRLGSDEVNPVTT